MKDSQVNSPAYCRPDVAIIDAWLEVVDDVYGSLEGKKERYLPANEKEFALVYAQRLSRAVFNNKLRGAIEANVGLLSAFEVSDLPQSVDLAQDDLDGNGSDFKAFFALADDYALRHDQSFVLVDYPVINQSEITFADRAESGRRPYLRLISRRNINSYRYQNIGGRSVLTQIVYVSSKEVIDGVFGIKLQKEYHQISLTERGVTFQTWMLDEKDNPVKIGEEVTLEKSEIPIVPYPCTSEPFPQVPPPFLKAARLNIRLLQKESLLDETEYRLSPTPYRKHPTAIPEDLPPLVLGPSWCIEVPNASQGGDVGILEVSPDIVKPIRKTIEEIKDDISAEFLSFLAGSRVQRTATDAMLSSAQSQASLNGYARNKASAIKHIFDFWCWHTGEANTLQVSMDHSVLELALDAQEMQALKDLAREEFIDRQTLLELLKMGKQLPPDADIESILQRLDQAENRRAQNEIISAADMAYGTDLTANRGRAIAPTGEPPDAVDR